MSLKYMTKQNIFYTVSDAEIARRHEAIRNLLREKELGVALLICRSGDDRNWINGARISGILSGGDGLMSGADILTADGDMYLTCDYDGFTQWAEDAPSQPENFMQPGAKRLPEFDERIILECFKKAGNRRLGFIRPENIDIALAEYLDRKLGTWEPVDITKDFDQIRVVRSDEEIEQIENSVKMHEKVFAAIPSLIKAGQTEPESINRIRRCFYDNGCGDLTRWIDCWIDMISTPDGAPPTNDTPVYPGRVLKRGDRVDISAHAIGENAIYAMCSRSYVLADEPNKETAKLWKVAVGASNAAAAALRPGASLQDAANAANEFLVSNGAERDNSKFLYSVEYGMEERPCLYDYSETIPLRKNMVIVVAPKASKKNIGTLCCGDIYVITEKGAKRLGNLPQEIFTISREVAM